jgi:hypothetical protein
VVEARVVIVPWPCRRPLGVGEQAPARRDDVDLAADGEPIEETMRLLRRRLPEMVTEVPHMGDQPATVSGADPSGGLEHAGRVDAAGEEHHDAPGIADRALDRPVELRRERGWLAVRTTSQHGRWIDAFDADPRTLWRKLSFEKRILESARQLAQRESRRTISYLQRLLSYVISGIAIKRLHRLDERLR